jgi:hypothetical protein
MYSLTMARAHPYRGYFLAERFDQRGRSSPPLAFRARWDSNHGVSPWNHTPHCQLIAVPVRLTNYVGRADLYRSLLYSLLQVCYRTHAWR